MTKFQLDFTKVPKALRAYIGNEVQKIFTSKGFEDKYNNCLAKPFVIIGYEDSNILSWNSRAYDIHEYFAVYDVVQDWDKWTKLLTPVWENKHLRLNEDYNAVVLSDHVQVGCQKISFEVVKKLANIVAEAEKFAAEQVK